MSDAILILDLRFGRGADIPVRSDPGTRSGLENVYRRIFRWLRAGTYSQFKETSHVAADKNVRAPAAIANLKS
jgi:hypothetical protein